VTLAPPLRARLDARLKFVEQDRQQLHRERDAARAEAAEQDRMLDRRKDLILELEREVARLRDRLARHDARP